MIDKSPYADIGTLFPRLRGDCADEWRAYVQHPFVKRMGDGSLQEAAFKYYLGQDYLFLIHFARAYALGVYKADNLDDMRSAAGTLNALLETEMSLHVDYCRGWGMTEADMRALPEDNACMAYTRYVLERGMAGDILDLQIALAPCVIGYGEIGLRLADDPATKRDNNPYTAWIDMYSGDEYQDVARAAVQQLDRLWESRGNEARYGELRRTFAEATRLEAAFWQMGLDNG